MNKWKVKICSTSSVGPKWQVVIPKEIRDKIGINTWDKVVILLRNDKFVWIVKANDLTNLLEYAKAEWIEIENS